MIETRVAGVTYENRQAYLPMIQPTDALWLEAEPDNPYDPHAVGVWWYPPEGERVKIGYLPRGVAAELEIVRIPARMVKLAQRAPGESLGLIIQFEV